MGKVLTRWVLLTLLVMLTVSPGPVAVSAQEGGGDDFGLDLSQFDGIETAVARGYAVSFTEEPVPGQLLTMSVMVLRFDSERHATDALRPLDELIHEGFADSGVALTEAPPDHDDPSGDEMIRYVDDPAATPDPLDELPTGIELLSVRSGDMIVLVIGLPLEGDAGPALRAVAEAVLERDAGDGDVSFDADGASTGGLFDRLPSRGDSVLAGTDPVTDTVLFPVANQA